MTQNPEKKNNETLRIALIGGGPAGLFMLKRFADKGGNYQIDVYEKTAHFGSGMPYSDQGARQEHVTNVSANEIPEIETGVREWLEQCPESLLKQFNASADHFNEYKVLPRLLFGRYLEAQFRLVVEKAIRNGLTVTLFPQTEITDVADVPEQERVAVTLPNGQVQSYQHVILCTGHKWRKENEKTTSGFFDSPYPPSKLTAIRNMPVALRGASLTAIDAIRTISRNNGDFAEENGKLVYRCKPDCDNFSITMHTRNGLLPAVRFHLEDSHLQSDKLLTQAELSAHMSTNDGFLSLDFIFEHDFKDLFTTKATAFYKMIKDLTLEQFTRSMLALRENPDAFDLLRAEYAEAERSIKKRESIYWKEALAILSFAMNYPAKHFSAEDMLRLRRELKPLISVVIAFIPQASCRELMALHDEGRLSMVTVGEESKVVPGDKGGADYDYGNANGDAPVHFPVFIDCIGQEAMDFDDFPFRSLVSDKTVNPAFVRFRDAEQAKREIEAGNKDISLTEGDQYYLRLPGVSIGDDFHVTDPYGANNPRIAIMAVPYISGLNPDYSGLDFCEAASALILEAVLRNRKPAVIS